MINSASPSSDIHVVTNDGEQCFMWKGKQLTYIAKDRQELPTVLASRFGQLANKLDLSYNTLTSYRNINLFTNLNELILDNNLLEDDQLDFKQNLRLKTLSLNKNRLCDLSKLTCKIKVSFPNLDFLSLIGNPLCPSPVSSSLSSTNDTNIKRRHQIFGINTDGANGIENNAPHLNANPNLSNGFGQEDSMDFAYQSYRHFIIYHLPNLRFLDSNPIGQRERDEALASFYWIENENLRGSQRNGMQSDFLERQQPLRKVF